MSNRSFSVLVDDMPEEMSRFTLNVTDEAFNLSVVNGKVFSTVASHIQKALSNSFGSGWNVIVGNAFGSNIKHQIKTYMFLSTVPGIYVLVWKA
mmetsp:Transcript_9618/g.13443  ORF Transcript_9618/g.13443 Transcript_9618/m.13443 type:complete len:94 (+) Transcript_9618:23-304(+)